MARKKHWKDVYLSGQEVRDAKFDILAEFPPTNVAAPYFIRFQDHSKLLGVRAQRIEVKEDRLRWLPYVKNTRWCSVSMDHVEFVRISVNLDIEMDFDIEF